MTPVFLGVWLVLTRLFLLVVSSIVLVDFKNFIGKTRNRGFMCYLFFLCCGCLHILQWWSAVLQHNILISDTLLYTQYKTTILQVARSIQWFGICKQCILWLLGVWQEAPYKDCPDVSSWKGRLAPPTWASVYQHIASSGNRLVAVQAISWKDFLFCIGTWKTAILNQDQTINWPWTNHQRTINGPSTIYQLSIN